MKYYKLFDHETIWNGIMQTTISSGLSRTLVGTRFIVSRWEANPSLVDAINRVPTSVLPLERDDADNDIIRFASNPCRDAIYRVHVGKAQIGGHDKSRPCGEANPSLVDAINRVPTSILPINPPKNVAKGAPFK